MRATHLIFLVEERSMETFLQVLLPKVLPETAFEIHPFKGKHDMMRNLKQRLRSYKKTLSPEKRLIVLVDRDNQDCKELKANLESYAQEANLVTRSSTSGQEWQVVNRVVVEELEAWYFGDWEAVCAAYPKVDRSIPRKAQYRDPDAIRGGTWEKFEKELKKRGYVSGGLPKIKTARDVAEHFIPGRNHSRSFNAFYTAVVEAVN